ncbi:damage-control phosphatase ARMT1 family protein [Candidatus Methanoprimaticola sp. MG2]|uniref:damage-control phosphatase ARMT1 family protein n=1 Tax=Candidatus Methanoprimaticola sp. MG2 TaxID=3228838 RepID=UPI0039C76349
MKFTADCGPCLMRRVLFQSRLVGNDMEFDAVRAASDVLAERMDPETDSVRISTEVHRVAYRAVMSDDPYFELKCRADAVAEPFERQLAEMVERSDDPIRTALLGAVAGNIMDFGSGTSIDDPDLFSSVYDDIVDQGLGLDDVDMLEDLIERSPGVVYIFDNCGECRLDAVLIRFLRGMGKRVVGVVRGEPILNDVTMQDAKRIGLDRVVDKMLTTGKFYVGIDWDDIPEDLSEEIRSCGLIVAKGMANYEATSGRHLDVPVVHILRSKCGPVARSLGVPQNVNVVKVVMPEAD